MFLLRLRFRGVCRGALFALSAENKTYHGRASQPGLMMIIRNFYLLLYNFNRPHDGMNYKHDNIDGLLSVWSRLFDDPLSRNLWICLKLLFVPNRLMSSSYLMGKCIFLRSEAVGEKFIKRQTHRKTQIKTQIFYFTFRWLHSQVGCT